MLLVQPSRSNLKRTLLKACRRERATHVFVAVGVGEGAAGVGEGGGRRGHRQAKAHDLRLGQADVQAQSSAEARQGVQQLLQISRRVAKQHDVVGVHEVRDQQFAVIPHLKQDAGVRGMRVQIRRQPIDSAAKKRRAARAALAGADEGREADADAAGNLHGDVGVGV